MIILVHSGCHDKNSIDSVAYTMEMCFFLVLEAWKSKIRGQHAQVLVRALCLAWRRPPSHCAFTWPFLDACAWTEQESKLSGVSFDKVTNPNLRAPPSCPHPNPITSQKLHLQILSHWGLGLQHTILGARGDTKHSLHNHDGLRGPL